jgi:hypothetical protein
MAEMTERRILVFVRAVEDQRRGAVLGDKPPKSRDRLSDSGIGHVGKGDCLAVEYAGWVRIVGT